MNDENSLSFYKKKEKEFNVIEKYNNFFEYFNKNWLSVDENIVPKFRHGFWSYFGKFEFKESRRKLIGEDRLRQYIVFSNNACESFNNFINSHVNSHLKVSITRFVYLLKVIFIRTESLIFAKNNNNITIETKTQLSDLLIELINLGFGKNEKMTKKKI